MCHISHNKYKKDKNAGRNETGYSEETINKYNNYTLQDLQDIELLQTQWKAQLILVLGYLLEYTASVQGINILQFRIKRRNEIFQAGQYGDKEESELINAVVPIKLKIYAISSNTAPINISLFALLVF